MTAFGCGNTVKQHGAENLFASLAVSLIEAVQIMCVFYACAFVVGRC